MSTIEEANAMSHNEEFNKLNIREIVNKYIFHWPVFIVGIVLCLFSAFLFLRYTQPVYLVHTTLLIKDDKNSGAQGGEDLLNELDLFGSSKVVDNEIEILKSKTLMRKVVDRLNLAVSFKAEGRIKDADLYAKSPVNISVIKTDSSWFNKELLLSITDSTYLVEDRASGKQSRGYLGRIQRDHFGVYIINLPKKNIKPLRNPITLVFDDPEVVVDRLLSNLTVGLASKQSTVLKLTFETAVPRLGQDLLNTLIQVYNEAALADKNQTTQSTIKFIDERLKLITGELTEVEKDVEGFKSSRGLTDISSDASMFLENVRANDAKLNEINLQISVVNDIRRYINSNTKNEKLPSTLGIDDPVLLAQINQLGELQLQNDQLLATTTENNPLVAPLARKIETTRAAIKATLVNISNTLEVSKANLERNNAAFQGSIKKIPGQERQLISIKRQQTIKESLYLYLLQKKEEAALSYASAVADSRTVDAAYYSKTPVSPKNSLINLAAILAGIALPILYIFIKDLLNDRVENKADLSKLTSAPILGEISFEDNPGKIVVSTESRKAIAEQFRAIRTNMQYLHGKQSSSRGNVTLFTSSISGEGKSFVASNLAAAFALGGKKTVLLELDLRKPMVSKYLDLPNSIGLSNYLIGLAKLEDIIKPTNLIPGFYMIGSGPIPPNPSELLFQKEIESLINELRKDFDEILIDTPPIGLVTDAQILAKLVDVTIYIVRQDFTLKNQVKALEQIFKNQKFPKLNVILNGVNAKGNYSYGYGYGYGYYSDDAQKSKNNINTVFKNFFHRF